MNELTSSLDFRLLFDAVVTRWRTLFLALLFTPVVALTANIVTDGQYRATSTIVIQDSVVSSPYLSEMSVQWELNTRLPVVQTVVASRSVAENILVELGELSPTAARAERDWMIEDFRSRVRVNAFPGGVIQMSFDAPTPQNARRGLQILIDTVKEEIVRPQRDSLDAEVEFLETQLERVRIEIEAETESLRTMRESLAGGASADLVRTNIELYANTRRQLESARANLAAAEQELRVARERLQAYDPSVQRIDRRIEAAQEQLRALQRDYTSSHPEVIAAQSELNGLLGQRESVVHGSGDLDINDFERLIRSGSIRSTEILNAELTTYREAVSSVEGLRQRVDSLSTGLAASDAEVGGLYDARERLEALENTLDTRRAHFQRLLRQYEESIVSRELTLQEEERQVWVLEEPEEPNKSDKTSNKLILLAGLFGGFVIGVSVIAFAEFIDRTVRVPREAEAIAGVPNIATLPPLDP